jgi:protein gp37
MAEQTAISWCDHTWSPWYGCTQVSMGEKGACVGCYARQLSEIRMGRVVFGGPGRGEGTRDARAESAWNDPVRWNKAAARSGEPCFVFPSMCDPFDNHPALAGLRTRFFDLIRATPNLTYLLLTKRPGNIIGLYRYAMGLSEPDRPPLSFDADWPRNAAIGCTVVTQEEADRDIPKLLAAKVALNPAFAFVSMEPLLGPVDLTNLDCGARRSGAHGWSCLWPLGERPRIDWVITGGETDQGSHKARPSHPDWFRSLRDQCAAAGVAYHHKQNGEFAEADDMLMPGPGGMDGVVFHEHRKGRNVITGSAVRVGKKAAGRLLDGVLHDARPA